MKQVIALGLLVFMTFTLRAFSTLETIADLEKGKVTANVSDTNNNITFDNYIYYSGNNPATGIELWRTDGITTELVEDIAGGIESSNPHDFAIINGSLVFVATQRGVRKLFVLSDNEVKLLASLNVVQANNGTTFTEYQGHLYFRVREFYNKYQLWRTDGSIIEIVPESQTELEGLIQELTVFKEQLLFSYTEVNDYRAKLASYNGAEFNFYNDGVYSVSSLAATKDKLYFVGTSDKEHTELWSFDGTTIALTKDIYDQGSSINFGLQMQAGESSVLFRAYDGVDYNLWISDANGTRKVSNHNVNSFNFLAKVENTFFFKMYDSVYGNELWCTQGQEIKTTDIFDGSNSSFPTYVGTYQGKVYITARESYSSNGLFSIDANCNLQKVVINDPTYIFSAKLFELAGELYFSLPNIYKFNAQDSSISSVINVFNSFNSLATINDQHVFFNYQSLMAFDGAEVKEVANESVNASSNPRSFVTHGSYTYFKATTKELGEELWRTNGDVTELVKDFSSGVGSGHIGTMYSHSDYLYFYANAQLWRVSDQGVEEFSIKDGDNIVSVDILFENEGELWFRDHAGNLHILKEDSIEKITIPSGFYLDTYKLQYKQVRIGQNRYFFLRAPQEDEGLWKYSEGDFTQVTGLDIPAGFYQHQKYMIAVEDKLIVITKNGNSSAIYSIHEDTVSKFKTDHLFLNLSNNFKWLVIQDKIIFVSDKFGLGKKLFAVDSTKLEASQLTDDSINFDHESTLTKIGETIYFYASVYEGSINRPFLMTYDGSEVKNTGISFRGFIYPKNSGSVWLIDHLGNELLEYDGEKVIVVTNFLDKIQPSIDESKVSDYQPLQTPTNFQIAIQDQTLHVIRRESSFAGLNQLWSIDQDNRVVNLTKDKSFYFNHYQGDLLMAGNNQWLYVTGCDFELGCELRGINYNQAPTIEIVSNDSYQSGETVVLDASGSSDDSQSISYRWTQLSGDTLDVSDLTNSVLSFIAPELEQQQNYTFEFTITDSDGKSSSQQVSFSITPNLAPEIVFEAVDAVDEFIVFTIDATASSDQDGEITQFQWTQVGGPKVNIIGSDTAKITVAAPSVESDSRLIFELTVTDNHGKTTTAQVAILVKNKTNQSAGTSGGGSSHWLIIVALFLMMGLRRKTFG